MHPARADRHNSTHAIDIWTLPGFVHCIEPSKHRREGALRGVCVRGPLVALVMQYGGLARFMMLARLTSRSGARPSVALAVLVLTAASASCQPGSETDGGAGSGESGSQPETAGDDTGTGGG